MNPTLPTRYPPPILGPLLVLLAVGAGCRPPSEASSGTHSVDPHFATNGTLEVTARLVEIPEGAIFQRELYDYATVLKYEIVSVQRGTNTPGSPLWVGHYNPWKPRSEVADPRAPGIGGTLRQFRAGDLHHLALEVPIEDHYMGGIVNKYFGQTTNPIHWAVWTARVEK